MDLASFRGESSCVECLMLHNASCESRELTMSRTPMHSAALNNNEECLKIMTLITNSRMEQNRLDRTFETCAYVYDDTLKTSFYNSKLANLKDNFERTPLMLAAEQGHLNTVTFLVNQMGADVLVSDSKGRTALHRAVSFFIFLFCTINLTDYLL